MPTPELHIVAFDIPYPPDYGGAIDVFYKVKNLSEAGIAIYLHCPQYGDRQPSAILEEQCRKVFYYKRKTGLRGISFTVPYMVYSRRDDALLQNLLSVDAPILFDGASTSYYLSHPALAKRIKILRPQNVEQDYYRLLAGREKSIFRKVYYLIESGLLRRYENRLHAADAFFTVALHDHLFFKERYPKSDHVYIPSFQPYNTVQSLTGNGSFCLYHGNLGLAENREAAIYLLDHIIPVLSFPFIIAGRNPDEMIRRKTAQYPHCRLIENPSMEQMSGLIQDAQIHVLPTFQDTGLKLKLLHALYNGRHVVVNEAMVHGTGLAELCHVTGNTMNLTETISRLYTLPFSTEAVAQRKQTLFQYYDNRNNAAKIISFLQQRSL